MARADDTELIDTFEDFYRSYYRHEIAELAKNYPDEQKSLYLDWEDLDEYDSDLADDFRNKPKQLREYAEEALRLYDLPVDVSLGQAHVRVTNLPETLDINDIQADHRGRLVTIQGSVKRATAVTPKITNAAFECQRCGTLTRIPQQGGDFQEPHECQGCERQGPFRINYDQSEFIDSQQLKIQSPIGELNSETPTSIEVKTEDDETGHMAVGDRVAVTGILQLEQMGSTRNKSSHFDTYLDALTVERLEGYPAIDTTTGDKKQIITLSNDPELYEKIPQTIAPTVHNHETEKLLLALQLFGGVTRHYPDNSQTRGQLHTLFVVDAGKQSTIDQLLSCAAALSPRAVQAEASETSGTGLTTTAFPSSESQGDSPWVIEAGPLIEADRGHAMISDFSDLGSDATNSVENVLRKQSAEATKATERLSLPARTSVLAHTKPEYDRFDDYQPRGEQIPLAADTVAAFDLVVLIPDDPDSSKDREVAKHTLATHSAGATATEEVDDAHEAVQPAIDPGLFRKYVAYARENCHPELTQAAKSTLQDYYAELREPNEENSPHPVTEDNLKTLIRLSEASARMRLSDTVEETDADRAIEVVETVLETLGIAAEKGELDADVS